MNKVVVSKFTHHSAWVFLVPAAGVLLGVGAAAVIYVIHINRSPVKKTTKIAKQVPQDTAKQLITAYNQNQQEIAKRPTDSQKLSDLQKKIANPTGDSMDQFQNYSDAALLAAGLNKPEAKTYAQKALQIFSAIPTDPRSNLQAYEQGLLYKLTAISKGDYSAAPK